MDPLAFRVLLIMPTLYRRWDALRLDDLNHWIMSWEHGSMMAGVKEKGAEDGWWLTALRLEACHVTGTPYSGAALDV